MPDPLKGSTNWPEWHLRIEWFFVKHKVTGYANRTIECPDHNTDPQSYENWKQNDTHACSIMLNNIASSQLIHIKQCKTSKKMWLNLIMVHQACGHHMALNYLQMLFKMSAEEGANISKHLERVKDVWSHINLLGDDLEDKDFHVSDFFFKAIIASSLPLFWDNFTKTYIGGDTKLFQLDPKKMMGSQEFIGLIISEYRYHKTRKDDQKKIKNTNVASLLRFRSTDLRVNLHCITITT